MSPVLETLLKVPQFIRRRIGEQGLRVTILWVWGRGVPFITGRPNLQYCEITPHLYVGPQFRKNGLRFLESRGIHAVVNLRIEKDDAQRGLAAKHYCYLPVIDDQAPTMEQLVEGVEFIHQKIGEGEKVYIHCGAGVGRAPSLAAAYLIACGDSLDHALHRIRSVRPFIYITPPQKARLHEFETNRRGSLTSPSPSTP